VDPFGEEGSHRTTRRVFALSLEETTSDVVTRTVLTQVRYKSIQAL